MVSTGEHLDKTCGNRLIVHNQGYLKLASKQHLQALQNTQIVAHGPNSTPVAHTTLTKHCESRILDDGVMRTPRPFPGRRVPQDLCCNLVCLGVGIAHILHELLDLIFREGNTFVVDRNTVLLDAAFEGQVA
jgi:hypothetical protein